MYFLCLATVIFKSCLFKMKFQTQEKELEGATSELACALTVYKPCALPRNALLCSRLCTTWTIHVFGHLSAQEVHNVLALVKLTRAWAPLGHSVPKDLKYTSGAQPFAQKCISRNYAGFVNCESTRISKLRNPVLFTGNVTLVCTGVNVTRTFTYIGVVTRELRMGFVDLKNC